MRTLVGWSVCRPRAVLAAAAGLVLIAASFATRVHVQLDARSLLPHGDAVLSVSDDAARVFGARDSLVLALAPRAGTIFMPETLARLASLTEEVRSLPGIAPASVTSLATLPHVRLAGDQLSSAGALLPPGRRPGAHDVARVRDAVARAGPSIPLLVAANGRAAGIVAEVEPAADRLRLLRAVRALAAGVSADQQHALQFTGSALAQAELGAATGADLRLLLPLVVAVVAGVLWLMLRRFGRVAASLLEVGFSLTCTIGLMGVAGETIFISTLVLPVVLVVVGVSDDVYALQHYAALARRARRRPVSSVVTDAFSSVTRPIGMTTLSTVIGLGSLAASGLGPLVVLGAYGAVAILLSWFSTFTIVPAVLVLVERNRPAEARSAVDPAARLFTRLSLTALPARPLRRLVIMAVTIVLLAVVGSHLQVDDSWVGSLPRASDVVAGERFVSEHFAGTMTLEVLIDSGRAEGITDPKMIAAIVRLEDALAAMPEVGAIRSPYREAAAAAREWRATTGSQMAGPLSTAEFGGGLTLIRAAAPGVLDGVSDPPLRRARVTVFLRSPDFQRIDRVAARVVAEQGLLVAAGATRVTLFGDAWISHRAVERLVAAELTATPVAILIDLVLFSVLLRSIRASLLAMIPVLASMATIAAVLVMSGLELGIANSMTAAIALGVGLDFSIHLVDRWLDGSRAGRSPRRAAVHAMRTAAPGILGGALSLAVGFSAMALAGSAPTRQLGLMTALALLACAAFALLTIPAIWLAAAESRGAAKRSCLPVLPAPLD